MSSSRANLNTPRRSRRVDVRRPGPRMKAALILAAAIGVPAFAAPGEWRNFEMKAEAAAPETVDPMPFEEAGSSFPGSAFFYLDDTPQMASAPSGGNTASLDTRAGAGFGSDTLEDGTQVFNPLAVINGDPTQAVEIRAAGPAARAFRGGGTGMDKARALQCLTQAIYYEAASESNSGQKAVAQVVLNRVMHPTYPANVCGVVYQGSARRTGCQFSFTCDGSMARKPSAGAWARARGVAAQALAGNVYKPVGYATHYHTIWISPYWASSLNHIGTIGAHRFYRWKGSAGTPGAFRAAYVGGERIPAPTRRSLAPLPASASATAGRDNDAVDPVALARAYEEARAKAAAEAGRRAPSPVYTAQVEAAGGDAQFTADKLPGAGTVRAEYANAGQWKADTK